MSSTWPSPFFIEPPPSYGTVNHPIAASARNLVPRLISSLCTTLVGLLVLGPVWAGAWFAATWTVVFAGMGLMRLIQAAREGPRADWLNRALTLVNVVSGSISATLPVALWFTGDALAGTYGLITLFIGAAYVLLQYYANLNTFLVLMTPYVAALGVIGFDMVDGRRPSLAAAVIVIAAVTSLVNFFHLSRMTLDRSRTALRQARARARAGEQAAEGANEAKSAFLATMSHEIRTPLNGVLGMAQAMAAETLSPVQRERLDIIDQSGKALLAILNDILDLSKIEAGKLELEEIEFDLGDVARGAHSAFTAIANRKGLSFALDIDQARGVYRGDPTRLRQILYNLISNALKFTEAGEIRVTALRTDEGLRFAVADSGVGIPPEAMGQLFNKFAQVDASTTRRFGGTGLGLAICQQLSRLMGGSIEVESEPGRGSTFTVILPMRRVGEARPAIPLPSPPDAQPEESASGLRVLAAEDNTVNQLVLKTLLHQIGVEPAVVADGAAVLEAWEAGHWDVILMDVQMPVMDGPTATRRIRERERETGRGRTPIIALTANAMSHHVADYLAAGMDDHVAKPIEAGRLFEALQTAVDAQDNEAAAVAV
ncbi:MAG TPA: ATP-binding protein [Caulobacteraceae bacterium]|nr:ATP-binding protein [Caulobacteraceae bacterium]